MVNGDFAKLTRKHGIKISAGFACTVEEIGLAVGEKVGHGSIKSLARMNSAVVIFLDQVEKVNCVIETGITRKGEFSSLRQWWDHGKTEIRLLCQQHTLNVTQDIIRSMKDLESDIVELETISETTGDRGYIEILKEKKMALANLLDVKVQGALVRSRFLNTNEMDAPTSFFFGLEKKNGQRRVIHSLLSGTGQEITEPSQIRRRAVSFYSTLYTSEYEEGETLSEGFCNGLPQVSVEANSQLEGPLTIQELQTALQGMQGRRAPGIDGLSVEFYKAYWDVLSHDLLDVFNESLASGSMPVSCRRAVITLLPKKGNLQDIKNWRPVSLLCVDYKILSKALATRLGKAVEQVIHRDQTYCVPGRSMVDNVHLIRDVLEVSSSLDINTGLISLDQEKAFDRVEHSFLWKVMEKFGFSAGFIAKIKVLYNKIESVLKFNARLDVSSSETPGLTVALCRSKTLCLQQLVDAVGPELSDAQALGSLLGLHSVRVAQRILQLWSQILCPEEKRLLRSYGQGRARPDPADPFPEIYLSPGLGELTGPLLQYHRTLWPFSTTVRYGPSVPPYAMALSTTVRYGPQYHRTLWPLSTTVRYGPSVPPYAMALSTTVRYGPQYHRTLWPSVPPYAMAPQYHRTLWPSVPPLEAPVFFQLLLLSSKVSWQDFQEAGEAGAEPGRSQATAKGSLFAPE
ncbi:hypothetical protein NHX12_015333 [Muraenolepis orangiensis]|uniref:Reverse transcriptase domain-containing protein n=1 Tax=Muraenolepis orangiensis TaxID=630683 RepID=A0A9Q0DC05_9TELE|nr:hypothetical protein NHX12_015333 [Muraenolepis orangiensis]